MVGGLLHVVLVTSIVTFIMSTRILCVVNVNKIFASAGVVSPFYSPPAKTQQTENVKKVRGLLVLN